MNPGRLDQRVAFQRREAVGGVRSGPLRGWFCCWAAWRPATAAQLAEVGAVSDAVSGTLTIHDTPRAREIAAQDRVTIRGSDLEVISAPIPDESGYLVLQLTRRLGGS